MNKDKLITDIKTLSRSLWDGGYVTKTLGSMDGNWSLILKDLNKGSTFSEAIRDNPFAELTSFENDLFVQLVHCGELGGVLEITLDRVVEYLENKKSPYSIRGFLNTVGIMISSGVPILTAIKNCPIDDRYRKLKDDLFVALKAGGTFYEPCEAFLSPDIVKEIHEAEYSGCLPEYLMNRLNESVN